jgi:hypothetical protein
MLNSGGLVLNWASSHGNDGPSFRHRLVGIELLSQWPEYAPQTFLVGDMNSISWPLAFNMPPTAWKLSDSWGDGFVQSGSQQEWSIQGFTYTTERAYWSNLIENIYCRDLLIPRWATTLAFLSAWTATFLLIRHWREQSRRHRLGLCPACGYDLRATPTQCPECGVPISSRA